MRLQRERGRLETRDNADAARIQRETEEEEVELTAIMLYLHLAGFELRGGRRASDASLSLPYSSELQ